jgi:menaquinol-cytochrome c reductase iron-sulfur subunit
MSDQATQPERRGFLKKLAAMIVGAIAMLVPAATGITFIFDPLRRKSEAGDFIKVASLNSLPEDGIPLKFSVIASKVDAWNRNPAVPVGAVYLRRTTEGKVQAFNVVCPHAGCFVDFISKEKGYFCPCHNSSFAANGRINDPKSPSPRGLDELEVEIRKETEVWVKFRNFQAGTHEKIPLS